MKPWIGPLVPEHFSTHSNPKSFHAPFLCRASSGGVSRAMQPTPAPVRRTAWLTAPAATAASTAGCRSAWQWACHEMVSAWWKRWADTAGLHGESAEVKSPGSSPCVGKNLLCWSVFEPVLQGCCCGLWPPYEGGQDPNINCHFKNLLVVYISGSLCITKIPIQVF